MPSVARGASMTRRIVELDGLHGLAALIVVIAHCLGEAPHGTDFLKVGWLGVIIFFSCPGS